MRSLILALSITVLAGCVTAVPGPSEDALDYLGSHNQAIDLNEHGEAVGATLLPTDAEVYLLGEAHGAALNEDLDFALMTYLYETAGVRTYIAEVGYCAGTYYDAYVQTGDRAILDQVFSSLRGTAAWSEERYRFWEQLAAFNAGKPAQDRIRVVGLDVEHQYFVGIGYLRTLLHSGQVPAAIAAPVAELDTIVSESAWSADRCGAAAAALGESISANRDTYAAYLGERLPGLEYALQSVMDGFAYRNARGADAENARDRAMYERFVKLSDDLHGPYYGKWGAQHVYQRQFRGLDRFAFLLDTPGSPVAGRVVSILAAYEAGMRLERDRHGSFAASRLQSPPQLLGPLLTASAGANAATLFRLTGPESPFARALFLLEHTTGRGVTTDYLQYIVLVRGAEAATLLSRIGIPGRDLSV